MDARTTDTSTLLDCPACKKPISADLVFDVVGRSPLDEGAAGIAHHVPTTEETTHE